MRKKEVGKLDGVLRFTNIFAGLPYIYPVLFFLSAVSAALFLEGGGYLC